MPFGHKAGLPPSKKYLLMRQPLLFPLRTSENTLREFPLAIDIFIQRP